MIQKNIKEFVFNAMLLHDSLKALETDGISVVSIADKTPVSHVIEADFNPCIWNNAVDMSSVYTALYCIENTIRSFIVERMAERHGIDWWNTKVPQTIRTQVTKLKEKESKNKYYSNRSDTEIGYTMLGNLAQIIIANWEDFSDIIPNQAWLTSRMDDLEMSRNIIMHTGILPQIEIDRIDSIVRDLFRQIG
jgi:hypothetical protein